MTINECERGKHELQCQTVPLHFTFGPFLKWYIGQGNNIHIKTKAHGHQLFYDLNRPFIARWEIKSCQKQSAYMIWSKCITLTCLYVTLRLIFLHLTPTRISNCHETSIEIVSYFESKRFYYETDLSNHIWLFAHSEADQYRDDILVAIRICQKTPEKNAGLTQ